MLVFDIARGILRDQRMRRNTMFFLLVAAMVMLFVGWIILDRWLVARPKVFAMFWLVCGWLTLTAMLLALYDMLALRVKAREERRRLRKRILDDDELN